MFLYTYVFLLNLIYLSYLVPSNDIFIPRCRYTISSPDSSGCSDKQAEESTLIQDKTRHGEDVNTESRDQRPDGRFLYMT